MIYEIQSKVDFSTGAELTVRIGATELDSKALYTIESQRPQFILPFRYKGINDQIEFVYQIGTCCKLQYLGGSRSPQEYSELWQSIFNPLFECADWFMNPLSFVLRAEHIYYDKNRKNICYVYIPSKRNCSGHEDIKSMAAELSRQITVTDANLENKVLRAIMKDFDPKVFIQMLKSHQTVSENGTSSYIQPNSKIVLPKTTPQPVEVSTAKQGGMVQAADNLQEIVINVPTTEKPIKEKPTKKNKEKLRKAQGRNGLFGSKKPVSKEIILGAAATPLPEQRNMPQLLSAVSPPANYDDITQLINDGAASGVGFRLLGHDPWPKQIYVTLSAGEAFTIGRFDVSIGRRQSSFEFDKNTKAVSRRHAAVERDDYGYLIVDLSSSAGTFVDGQRLPPNMPHRIKNGDRVSFGNAGADYMWEEV